MLLARRGYREGGPVVSSRLLELRLACRWAGTHSCFRAALWRPLSGGYKIRPLRIHMGFEHARGAGLLANLILSLALIVQIFSRGSTIDDSTLLVGFTA